MSHGDRYVTILATMAEGWSSMRFVDVSVVVCTYNRRAQLASALQSFEATVLPSGLTWELLVVDNNSSDGTAELVQRVIGEGRVPVRYVREPKQGLAHARNAGIRAATGHVIAFTDDDVTVDTRWVAKIWETFSAFGCAAVGGRIVDVWTQDKPSWYSDTPPYKMIAAVIRFDRGDAPCALTTPAFGANMAFRRGVFEKYGLFRTDLGRKGSALLGGEDTELFRRILTRGELVRYAPDAVVYHPVDPERLTKRYFLAYAFNYGRSAVIMGIVPEKARRYFGVPRYLFRMGVDVLVRWVTSWREVPRFYYKLQLFDVIGQMYEARRQARRTAA